MILLSYLLLWEAEADIAGARCYFIAFMFGFG